MLYVTMCKSFDRKKILMKVFFGPRGMYLHVLPQSTILSTEFPFIALKLNFVSFTFLFLL